ncbi:hypothetical protein DDB_G0285791 [Dictyostelium discoideum AX4]|uniref:Uncharacterized protein n=1 Tax=Dictyostelium discoideum TaxID=44689 RepID=Q54MW2_DICDI|nr:hypothetical protein DDB_G0285791 [Dictyostelium discoideum AX4]EAL64733.1 hypothetical protein DDB_G0285791 [Dictyostelium discoideum AX4]|eukprot:XP_638181.1 hypothetical protein DDB_G0285791 [Dictyostelium discoideum AX4]
MKFKSLQILNLIIISFYFNLSNSTITNYVLLIGRDLNCTEDIPRASLLTITNQAYAMNIKFETNDEVFNFTFSKYYLNNLVSLGINESPIALFNYNNFTNLINNLTNESQFGLNNTFNYINTVSKFSNLDNLKLTTISNSVSQMLTKIKSIKNVTVALDNNIKSINSPTKVVMDSYQLVSSSLNFVNNRISNIITTLNSMKQNVNDFQNELDYYSIIGDDDDHMTTMNDIMKSFLNNCFMYYNYSVFFSRFMIDLN